MSGGWILGLDGDQRSRPFLTRATGVLRFRLEDTVDVGIVSKRFPL